WKKDKIGSELAYLQAKSQSDAATARLNMLKARLANTVVRAPISGTFEGKYLETGEMASPGTPLIRIINTDKVKISGGVPERYAMFIAVGDSAIITFDILPDKEFEGTISFVGGAVDSDNRTFPIEIMLANRERNVKPNMVANIQLVRERRTGVVTVPREVIVRTEYGYQLYVAQEFQGSLIASARWVEMGPAHKNNVIIEAGLDPGELLITLGYQQVDHGTPIRLVNTGEIVLAGEDNQ
ncbi:MAG: efflux RND transporter periplasmic adaptor subunit, partial [Candidatus Marinimicrobia bacterium]|nr:efflux RND transporter periplasmic adaptor subunit [Candidatus Neomarinimicrobiota bacterium]